MDRKSALGILVIAGLIVWALVHFGRESQLFGPETTTSTNNQWAYDPPIYLCHLVQVFGFPPNPRGIVGVAEAGLQPWMTIGPRSGPPQPTERNPNLSSYEGGADPYIDTSPGTAYFFDRCLGPFSNNLSLCGEVRAQGVENLAADYKKYDCRISLRGRS
ncbi:hypothetical protein [Nocardia tengchongensis]|uniref:hypothetical protein n=1 Tax=Nocardia tengchongensis TaxID=2055889 RepID=UPI00369C78A8